MPFWILTKDNDTRSKVFGAGCIGFMNCLNLLTNWSQDLAGFNNTNIKSLLMDCTSFLEQFGDPEKFAAQVMDGPLFFGFGLANVDGKWYWEAPLKGEYKDRTVSSMMLLRNLSENQSVYNSFKFLCDQGLMPYQAVIAASLVSRTKRLDGEWHMHMRRYEDDSPYNTEHMTMEMLIAIIKGDVAPEYWQTTWEDPNEPCGYHCDGDMSGGGIADFDDDYGDRLDMRRCMFISQMKYEQGTYLCNIQCKDFIFTIVNELVKGE